jgi:small-conductance mechanosensitive channel
MSWREYFTQELWGNSYERWATAATLTVAGYLVVGLARSLLLKRLRRIAPLTSNRWDDFFLIMVERTSHVFLFAVLLLLGIRSLVLPPVLASIISHVFTFIMFIQIGRWITAALNFYAKPYVTINSDQDAARATMMRSIFLLANIVVWIAVGIQILENWDIKISALVAGLGVGGIAVGLALQNVLVDVFASLAIVFDKPFVIGDSIGVGEDSGSVEYIGLKTTRLKSLTGEQLIFSNSDLLKNRIRNYKRQKERRVAFKIIATLDTPPEKLEKIPGMIKDSISQMQQIRFDRAHFSALSLSGFEHELVYIVTTADYNVHMNVQQAFLHQMVRKMNELGVKFSSNSTSITIGLSSEAEGKSNATARA